MVKWYYNLYVGRKAEKYSGKIIKRLSTGKTDVGHYAITLAANPGDMLDIVNTFYLTQKSFAGRLPMIVGLAFDRDEAIQMAAGIIEESLAETGSPDARAYLESAQAGFEAKRDG